MTTPVDRSPAEHFYFLAWEYAEAAKTIVPNPQLRTVAFYLVCHSIELSLKAFLKAKGWDVADLSDRRQIGHNLENALRHAEQAGLAGFFETHKDFRDYLRVFNISYENKHYEYPLVFERLDALRSRRVLALLLDGAENLLAQTKSSVLRIES